ncbi:sensor histidine kinase [Nonomuraea sediminis]|uniref:sensor histidine kinase n=1 Tax=Nonomuraea sediminis TaxID=2835864 RepID=UPI001BDD9A27|nr:sensor histidine kinase [Nonomuraea sediminis]
MNPRVWSALPYLFILLPAVFSLVRQWRPEVLALVLAAVGWQWFMAGRTERLAGAIAYLAVLLGLVAVLIRIDSLFMVICLGAFIQAFLLLPGWWAYAGVAATAAVLVSTRPWAQIPFSFLVATLVASAAGLAGQVIRSQNESRKRMIAKLAALAEENADLQARLVTGAREAGVLQERQRLAREIHDTIAQGLTGILTQIEAIDDPAGAGPRLDTVRELARESLAEARRSVQALRPAPLEQAQLAAALEEVAEKWSRACAVPATVSVTGDARPLHADVEATLLRVAQEALANVAKHAAAGRVGITLSYMEDVVVLDVRDDGSGFSGSGTAGGFGLVAMRQRVTRLAGRFEVETAPGQGTGISATVPALGREA